MDNSRFELRLGYLRLPAPRLRTLTFIYGGLLGNPSVEECAFLVQQILQSLKHGGARTAYFNHLRADSPLYPALLHGPDLFTRDPCPVVQIHRCLTIGDSFAEVTQRLSKKMRANIRLAINRANKALAGPITLRTLTCTNEIDELLSDIEDVASKAYQRGLGVGFAGTPGERARLHLKAEKGWLRTYILYTAETPVAYFSGTLYKRVLHGDFMGYDPAFRSASVGSYLMIRIIESLCGEKCTREADAIDFGLGDAFYKSELCDQEWQDASLYLFAPGPVGLLLNAYRTTVLSIDRLLRRAMGTKLQDRMKRIWRKLVIEKPAPQ